MKKIIIQIVVLVTSLVSTVGCKEEEVSDLLQVESPEQEPAEDQTPAQSNPVTQIADNSSVDSSIHLSSPSLNSVNLSSSDYLIVQGFSGESFNHIDLFSDSNCQNIIASASQSDFANGGVYVQFDLNQSTHVYGQLTRSSGVSTCQDLFVFTQDSVAPQAPVFASLDQSTYNQNGYVIIYGQAQADVAVIKLYSDAQCAQQVGVGVGQEFHQGINFWYANQGQVTDVYAISEDSAGNDSGCTQMAQFTY